MENDILEILKRIEAKLDVMLDALADDQDPEERLDLEGNPIMIADRDLPL